MQIATMGHAQTMSSREIAELVEKRHDNVKRVIESCADRGVFTLPQIEETSFTGVDGRKQTASVYNLDKRSSLIVVAQLCPEFTARIVDRWQELEAKQATTLPQTYIEALEQLLSAKKAEQLAIETKAHIGQRREATAMNTASQAVKKVAKLEIELDKSKQYATVKRMEMLYHGQRFDWRHLRSTAAEMGIPSIDVFDQNYGTVKAYHADVWADAYALTIE